MKKILDRLSGFCCVSATLVAGLVTWALVLCSLRGALLYYQDCTQLVAVIVKAQNEPHTIAKTKTPKQTEKDYSND